ncbi:hypothetical protein ACSBR2_008278 [Camellia fascicularis]
MQATRSAVEALMERWWDATNSLHFSSTREMMMTPYDFSMITGLPVGGDPIPFESDMGSCNAAQLYLLRAMPPKNSPRIIRYN